MVQIVLVNHVIQVATAVIQVQVAVRATLLNLDILVTKVPIVYVWIDTIILECRLVAAAIQPATIVQTTASILAMPAILFPSEFFQVVLASVRMGIMKLPQLWNYVRYVHILVLLAI